MRILAIFSGGFSAAIFLACYLNHLFPPVGLAAVAAALCAASCLLRRRYARKGLMAALLFGGLCAGALWYAGWCMAWLAPAEQLVGQKQMINGTVTDWPEQNEYGMKIPVRMTNSQPEGLRVILSAEETEQELRPGDSVAVVCEFQSSVYTKGNRTYRYLLAQGIPLTAEAVGPMGVRHPEQPPLRYLPAVWAGSLKQSVDTCFPPETAPLVKALVTGDRSGLERSFITDLQRTGLAHTIAVSGMHLAVLASVLELILGRGKRSTALLLSFLVLVFCGLVGNTPSVLRAAVMILMLQIAPLLNRERDDCTSLMFALMLLLAWNPMSAMHVGLQMSFAAVAGIMLFAERIRDCLSAFLRLNYKGKNRFVWILMGIPRFVIGVLATTLAASLITVPLSAIHFHTISLIAPLANIAALWAVSLLFIGGLASGLIGLMLPEVGILIARAFSPLADYLTRLVSVLTRPTYAAIPADMACYRIWLLFVYSLVLLLVLIPKLRRRGAPLCLLTGGISLCLVINWAAREYREGDFSTTVLDVGQGQCVLLRSDDYIAVVDCGGFSGVNAGDLASDYLQARGCREIDLLVLTHYHADHSNGVVRLMQRMNVSELAIPDVDRENPLRGQIEEAAIRNNTSIQYIREDTLIVTGDNGRIKLIAPLGKGKDVNEECVTAIATKGNYDVLITGDMNSTTEHRLMNHTALPDVELMLAGHHGAAASNCAELLMYVRPEQIVVSAGKNNKYGHPSPEALKRFALVDAEVLRTDQMGTVTVRPETG